MPKKNLPVILIIIASLFIIGIIIKVFDDRIEKIEVHRKAGISK